MELRSNDGRRAVQISVSVNDKPVSVERENQYSGVKPCNSRTIGSNGDYPISLTPPRWKDRWELFPLPQVTYGQTKSVTDRLLLQCQNDTNSDETNLGWLAKELLSQRFSLPVRTELHAMWAILLTNVQPFDLPPLSSRHVSSDPVCNFL